MILQGKTVVVTGGFGALGSVVAEEAAKRDASVAALDFAAAPPAGFAERLGPKEGAGASSAFVWPRGRCRSVPLTTSELLRPW